jgi:hypothetical protein
LRSTRVGDFYLCGKLFFHHYLLIGQHIGTDVSGSQSILKNETDRASEGGYKTHFFGPS